MTASMKSRADRATIDLIRMSASKLVDDTKIHLVTPLRPPMKPATATIGECLAFAGRLGQFSSVTIQAVR
jgi:hypothetical protein